jgi:hypothetical protein
MKYVICPVCCWTGEVSRIDKPCPGCHITGADLPLIPKYRNNFAGVRKKGKMIFEVFGHHLGSEVLITDTEQEAIALARSYGMHWGLPVQLYRVPCINRRKKPWDASEIQLITEIPG